MFRPPRFTFSVLWIRAYHHRTEHKPNKAQRFQLFPSIEILSCSVLRSGRCSKSVGEDVFLQAVHFPSVVTSAQLSSAVVFSVPALLIINLVACWVEIFSELFEYVGFFAFLYNCSHFMDVSRWSVVINIWWSFFIIFHRWSFRWKGKHSWSGSVRGCAVVMIIPIMIIIVDNKST